MSLRVRERRSVDLILDQGLLAAGWHAHTLDGPVKFYVLAEGHAQPRRRQLSPEQAVVISASRVSKPRSSSTTVASRRLTPMTCGSVKTRQVVEGEQSR